MLGSSQPCPAHSGLALNPREPQLPHLQTGSDNEASLGLVTGMSFGACGNQRESKRAVSLGDWVGRRARIKESFLFDLLSQGKQPETLPCLSGPPGPFREGPTGMVFLLWARVSQLQDPLLARVARSPLLCAGVGVAWLAVPSGGRAESALPGVRPRAQAH